MNFKSMMSHTGFWVKSKSPELLVTGAIIAAMGSIILAIRATPKAQMVIGNANVKIKRIKEEMNNDNEEYPVSLGKRDLTKAYAKTVFDVGMLYLPTIVGFGLTVGGILSSHKIMKGRNMAIAAAYTTLENGFKSYRNRVAAKVGEKVENDIYRNMYSEDKEIVIDKDGNEVVTVKKVMGPHIEVDSNFSVIYDKNASNWTRDTNMVLNLLAMKEKWLNQKLIFTGALFLHEVYEELGIDIAVLGDTKAQAARCLGWIYDPSDNTRDSYISMGLFDRMGNRNEYAMDALRKNEQELFLDFNVDGDILSGKNGTKMFAKFRKVM